MVNKWCVVGCKSNYVHVGAKPEKVSVFKLPKDPIESSRGKGGLKTYPGKVRL